MFNWYNTSTIEKLRRQDEIAAAEKFHLIQEISNRDAAKDNRKQHILARLGVKLVNWGYRLQARYDELVVANVGSNMGSNTRGSHSNP